VLFGLICIVSRLDLQPLQGNQKHGFDKTPQCTDCAARQDDVQTTAKAGSLPSLLMRAPYNMCNRQTAVRTKYCALHACRLQFRQTWGGAWSSVGSSSMSTAQMYCNIPFHTHITVHCS
jgi:hypothetical protein